MRNKGFTLTELSVVILIIGIIISAVISGLSLIKQSRLRSVISEGQSFQIATNAFRLKYNSLPGDIGYATALWYNASTCPGTTGTAGGCNGNENGKIDYNSGATAANNEIFRFWQHLSLSGLLPQSYTATLGSNGYAIIGTSLPSSKYKSLDRQGVAGWSLDINGGTKLQMAGLVFNQGSFGVRSQITVFSDAVSPLDAYTIDIKMDDGVISSGDIQAIAGAQDNTTTFDANCTDGTNPTGYKISNADRGCTLTFSLF